MTFEPISDHLMHKLERSLDHSTPTSAFPGIPAQSARSPAFSPIGVFLLSDVPSKPLSWLWPGRIPLGHLTLLDAAPDCGLSLLALTLAACVSRGSPLPDGTPTPQGNVILLAPYDSASETIKPRLSAAGGDPAHVLLFRPLVEDASRTLARARPFTFPQDLDDLATMIRCLEARLVILDPASAIPGLSRCLPALIELAQQANCAILLTRSLQKPPATPFSAAPATPLLQAARSRLLLTPNPADEHTCLLVTTKHSLCTQPSLLAYEILATQQGIPTLHWLGEWDRPSLTRLCTGPIRSLHRQAILRFLHHSPTPHSIKDILNATSYDYEAGRKMLLRMKQAGELVPVAPGLYTTLNHPCLAHDTAHPHPDTPQSSVPPVPLVPHLDHPTAAAPPATETSCATGAPLPMEARLPEDPVGEVSKDGEQSDAGCVGARLIAPLGGVGHTSPAGSATNVPPVPHGSPPNGSIPHNPHVPPLTNVPPVPASENSTSHLPPLPIPQRTSEPDRPVSER